MRKLARQGEDENVRFKVFDRTDAVRGFVVKCLLVNLSFFKVYIYLWRCVHG